MKNFKRFLSLCLCFAVLLTSLLGVFAAEEEDSSDEVLTEEEFSDIYDEAIKELETGFATGVGEDVIELGEIHTMDDLMKYIEQEQPYPAYDRTGLNDMQILFENMQRHYAKYDINTALTAIEGEMNWPEGYLGGGRFVGFDYENREAIRRLPGKMGKFAICLATVYNYEGCKYYKDPEVKQAALDILQDQCNIRRDVFDWNDPDRSSGFYQFTINPWKCFTWAVFALYDEMSPELIADCAEELLWMPFEIIDQWNTGTNAIWYACQAITRGAWLQDEYWVNYGINRLNELIVMNAQKYQTAQMSNPVEGAQPDGGWHMHGNTYYQSYAQEALNDSTLMAAFLEGTKFVPYYKGLDNLRVFAVDGGSWIARENRNANWFYGRQVAGTIISPMPNVTRTALCQMYKLYPDKQDEILEAIRALLDSKDGMYQPYEKAKYFFRSDFLAVHRKDWSFWVRGTSNRTEANEFNGYEAYKTFWGHNGTTQIDDGKTLDVRTYPFTDWKLYNGATTADYIYEYHNSSSGPKTHESFCGGVSDGYFASMTFKMNDKIGVSATKSWFAFEEGILSIGSGIRSSHWADINTTIEQEMLDGEVYVNGAEVQRGESKFSNVKTVFHGTKGYYFPKADDVCIRNKTVTARPIDQNRLRTTKWDEQSGDIFALYIPHGKNPANEKYEVVTLINTTPEKLAEFAANPPIVVVENSNKAHAAYHKEDDIAFATFFDKGSVTFPSGMVVKVDVPSMLVLSHVDGKLSISASNPYNFKTTVNVTVVENGKVKKAAIKLPGLNELTEDYGGSTVTTII